MIGFMEATEGDAIINGRNIKTDMNEIYSFMVCSAAHAPACKLKIDLSNSFTIAKMQSV
jgi:hypothetical protein